MLNGHRREIGLGGSTAVGLKDARELAARWRQEAILENDPIKLRNNERREVAKTDTKLKNVALAAFETCKPVLKAAVKLAAGSLLLNFMCLQKWANFISNKFIKKILQILQQNLVFKSRNCTQSCEQAWHCISIRRGNGFKTSI